MITCLVLGAASGCTGAASADGLGYVSADGRVILVERADRGAPVELEGEDLAGDALSVAGRSKSPTVVNVWGAWCAECRSEAPILAHLSRTEDASFVGIDVRDSDQSQAVAFNETFGITYPSFYDPNAELLLAFDGRIPFSAVPATIVLDSQRRVAGILLGAVPSKITLTDMIAEAR